LGASGAKTFGPDSEYVRLGLQDLLEPRGPAGDSRHTEAARPEVFNNRKESLDVTGLTYKLIVNLKGITIPKVSPALTEEEADEQLRLIAAAQHRAMGVAQLPWVTFRGADVIVAEKVESSSGEERRAA
jgi:hypothetical protein